MPLLLRAGCLAAGGRLAGGLRLFALCCGWFCLAPAAAIDLQGHRGARGLAPENTLTAFRAALDVGVTTLETDLALTRDGVLVLSHDPRLSPALTRGPDGVWLVVDGPAIRELDATTLASYDVGRLNPEHPYAAQWPAQKPADGERIPALVDLFDLARAARSPGGRPVQLSLETKITPRADVSAPDVAVFAQAVVDAVRAAGFTDRVTVQSFDWRTLIEVRRLEPALTTACLTIESTSMDTVHPAADGASAWHAGLKAADYGHSIVRLVRAAGCSTWSPYWRNLTAELVAEAHAAGLRVVAWTVNEPSEIERLAALGVDGLITDFPDRARIALQARGLKVD